MTTTDTQRNPKAPIGRDTIRSRLVLEVASEMVDQAGWPNRQARVSLRPQGADGWTVNIAELADFIFRGIAPQGVAQLLFGGAEIAFRVGKIAILDTQSHLPE